MTAVLVVVLLTLATRSALGAEPLPVAGDDGHLWLVVPGETVGSVEVLHRGQADPGGRLVRVEALNGQLAAGGAVAAEGDRLYVAYRDGAVQVIRAGRHEVEPGWAYYGGREAPLPVGGELRAWAATAGSPWALMRLTDAQAPKRPTPAQTLVMKQSMEEILQLQALGLPPGVRLPEVKREGEAASEGETKSEASEERPEEAPRGPVMEAGSGETAAGTATASDGAAASEGAASDEASEEKRDYLLRLAGARWEVAALPADWREPERAWLVAPGNGGGWPVLAAQRGDVLAVYRHDGETWQREAYELQGFDPEVGARLLYVEGQLVLARELRDEQPVRVELSLLRDERVTPIGVAHLDAPPESSWGVAPLGLTAAVVVRDPVATPPKPAPKRVGPFDRFLEELPPLRVRWARMDLSGTLVQTPEPLERYDLGPWVEAADWAIMAFIAVLTLVMIVVLWRRDPAWNRVELPRDLAIADLARRGMAGAADLAVPMIAVMWWYDLGLQELVRLHWPSQGVPLPSAVPGLWVIGLFIAHTTVSELASGRSLGKAISGLRVADVRGRKAAAWQVLVRGLLKVVDLVAPLLLLLPVIGPFRQRLGDVLARTVVVMPREENDDAPPADEEDGA